MKKTKLKVGDVVVDKSGDVCIIYAFPALFPKYATVRHRDGLIYLLKRNLIKIGEL